MRLNIRVSLILCSRTSTSSAAVVVVDVSVVAIATVSGISALIVVVDISVVSIATVTVVVDIVGTLRVRGTVDIPRLMMVCVPIGVNVGASIPN
jgi:hypothetical protein